MSVLPYKMEPTLLGSHILPPVNLGWHLGTLPTDPLGAPCNRHGIHPFCRSEGRGPVRASHAQGLTASVAGLGFKPRSL